MGNKKQFMCAIHGKKNLEDIDPLSIVNQCGKSMPTKDEIYDDIELIGTTE